MVQVRNAHVGTVAGLAPGATGDVDPATVERYPWALKRIGSPATTPGEWGDVPAREQRRRIAESNDPAYVRPFLKDQRSSVAEAAARRMKAL